MNFYSRENPTRWPFTFAYDWIRAAGLAESRADAGIWFQKFANGDEALKLSLIEQAAQEYCNYYNEVEQLEKSKQGRLAFWKELNPVKEDSAWVALDFAAKGE